MFKPSGSVFSPLAGGFGKPNAVAKTTNVSGGMLHPSFKFRVKANTMATAYPGANKPIAFPKMNRAYQ